MVLLGCASEYQGHVLETWGRAVEDVAARWRGEHLVHIRDVMAFEEHQVRQQQHQVLQLLASGFDING